MVDVNASTSNGVALHSIAPPKLTRESLSTPKRLAKFIEYYKHYASAYNNTAESAGITSKPISLTFCSGEKYLKAAILARTSFSK
jgi:hypothetical protein